MWVNATLIDSALYIHETLMRPRDTDPEEYYRQARIVAEVLGCPLEAQPPDLAAFRAYMAETLAALEVTDAGREVANAVLWPRKLRILFPGLVVFRLVTAALLPEHLRDAYGLKWTPGRRRAAGLLLWSASVPPGDAPIPAAPAAAPPRPAGDPPREPHAVRAPRPPPRGSA